MSMIGSPDRLIQRVPRRVFSSISRLAKGWRESRIRPSALVPPSEAGQRMADHLVGRAAEQGGHPRRDVDDAILGIDLPQPADAAMLIFVEQQPDRFRLRAGPGEHLQLAEDPAGQPRQAERAGAGDEHEGERDLGVERPRRRNNKRGRRPPVSVAIQATAAAGTAASATAVAIIATIAPPITTWTCGGWVAKA